MELFYIVLIVLAVAGGVFWYFNKDQNDLDINDDGKVDVADLKEATKNVSKGIKAEVKKEVKKEIIPEPVIEEVIEPEVKTDPPELESAPKVIGAISEISQPLDKYYLIVASFLDNDLAFDYAEKLILSESNVIIIQPFSTTKFTKVALEYETLDNKIFFIRTRRIFLKVVDDEIIANIGLDKYKDEFDEQLWVLKY